MEKPCVVEALLLGGDIELLADRDHILAQYLIRIQVFPNFCTSMHRCRVVSSPEIVAYRGEGKSIFTPEEVHRDLAGANELLASALPNQFRRMDVEVRADGFQNAISVNDASLGLC